MSEDSQNPASQLIDQKQNVKKKTFEFSEFIDEWCSRRRESSNLPGLG